MSEKATWVNIGPVRLAVTADNLNHMPRKIRNWESAHTICTQLDCKTETAS